ncbi:MULTISPECIES: hypothetical protein [Rhodococcus]|uniref:hypothetical protein n=1 Tax=Rhodococcus TaxID=1827 RepID=UPI0005732EB6|nr:MULTISPECIES: hypothetical protein [Rhodococcus]APE07883.1 hypothetical protein BO226_00425 [Rhodococcus sp. 2G]AYA25235.1 hypothetical protein C6369_012615 [Rhodococcus rhodochrous]KHJ70356.1 hypothetical protein QR64_23795 [Rhodococcus sp. Chr-9]MCD2098297.1 hypothetical protein [Rhodococcus rhodochrous]MCD2122434.1 hypothetical protein [Rhodococcus rhodochrous]
MTEIGLLGALLGDLLSLLSPCSALLLPSFFAYAFDGAGRLAARTALFYAGLTSVLAPLGAGLGLVGALLTQQAPLRTHTASLISGLLFIGIGVLFLVTDGTANLTGLMGVDEQLDLQVALGQWATDMHGPGLLLTVAVIAFAAVAVRVIRQRRQHRPGYH